MVKTSSAKQEMRVRFLGREDPLEKEMATHSSILAWEILWTEELGRLQSMGLGLQRVRHDLAAKLTVVTFKKDKQGSNWEKVSRAPEMLEIFYFLT